MDSFEKQEQLNKQLLNASRYGNATEIGRIIESGAYIEFEDIDDPFHATALSEACRRGKVDSVKALLQSNANANHNIAHGIAPLMVACENGYDSVALLLIEFSAVLVARESFNLDTALHLAAANNHSNIVKILVTAGANMNAQNRTGDTPLHLAVASDYSDACQMLLNLGADFLRPNHAEMNPYHIAQLGNCRKCIPLLRQKIDEYYGKTERKDSSSGGDTGVIDTLEETKTEFDEYDDNSLQTIEPSFDNISGLNSFAPPMVGNEAPTANIPQLTVFKTGWLKKQGKTHKTFQNRFFVLYSNAQMFYFNKEVSMDQLKQICRESPKSLADEQDVHALPTIKQSTSMEPHTIALKQHGSPHLGGKKNPRSGQSWSMGSFSIGGSDSRGNISGSGSGSNNNVTMAKGVIDCKDLIETQFLEFINERNGVGFGIVTPVREWKFKCDSDQTRREWIAAIHAVNYGISASDFRHFSMDISYQNNTFIYQPTRNSFLGLSGSRNMPVQEGWMYKLGAAISGLEKNYWKKRWVSLLRTPARLTYSEHPNSTQPKGSIPIKTISKITKMSAKDKPDSYRCPTTHILELTTPKRAWLLCCLSNDECQLWMERIRFFMSDGSATVVDTIVDGDGDKRRDLILNSRTSLAQSRGASMGASMDASMDETINNGAIIEIDNELCAIDDDASDLSLHPQQFPISAINRGAASPIVVASPIAASDVKRQPLSATNSAFLPQKRTPQMQTSLSMNNVISASPKKKATASPLSKDDSTKPKKGIVASIFRKVSDWGEMIGIAEQHAVISSVQPKGTIVDVEHIEKK